MKNLFALAVVLALALLGSSEAGKTEGVWQGTEVQAAEKNQSVFDETGVFAFIPYWSGRIDCYKVAEGKFEKTGDVRIEGTPGKIICDHSGRYLYVSVALDYSITRFKIGDNGKLTEPVTIKHMPDVQMINDMAISPSGKFLLVSATAGDLDGRVVGSISSYAIGEDGVLKDTLKKVGVEHGLRLIRLTSAGDFLIAASPNVLRSYMVAANGELKLVYETHEVDGTSIEMAFTPDGKMLLIGTKETEYTDIALCSVENERIKKLNMATKQMEISRRLPQAFTHSIAADPYGNILIVDSDDRLTWYKIQNKLVYEIEKYINYKDHRWSTLGQAEALIVSTPEYAARLQARKSENEDVMYAAIMVLSSHLSSAASCPDGNIYVCASNGVYRFKSAAQGLDYDGPAITWADTKDKFRGPDAASDLELGEALPRQNCLVFAERK